MLRKQKQSDHHITFFYAVIIVSSSATAVHNRPSNEHNLHNSFSLNNGLNLVMHGLQFVSQYTTLFVVARNPPHMTMVFSREYIIKKKTTLMPWATLEKPVSVLILLIRNPHTCSQAT